MTNPEKPPQFTEHAEQREGQPYFFHASPTGDIQEFEPRKRSTPGTMEHEEVPLAVYAGDDPAYVAAHGFLWGSAEGFRLGYEGSKVVFEVPQQHAKRLEQKVYLYKLPKDTFVVLENVPPLGHNFWSTAAVKPVESPQEFQSIREAIECFGGEVRIIGEAPLKL